MTHLPLIAAIQYERFFPLNELLAAVVAGLRARGIAPGGVLEEAEPAPEACRAPLNVVDLRSGETARITQECGEGSRGCHLDERGLAAITPRILNAIEARAPLIIISKFGRSEADGGGLMPCIADAVASGLPVLTAAREPYLDAWRAFHGGLGVELPPNLEMVLAWCVAASVPRTH